METSVKNCEICREAAHKYKCPKCLIKYCSLACYKSHQDSLCEERVQVLNNRKAETVNCQNSDRREHLEHIDGCDVEDRDKVPEEVLSKLGESDAIKEMLRNKHLVQILCHIDSTQRPDADMEAAMHEPIFTEFVDECLRIVEPAE